MKYIQTQQQGYVQIITISRESALNALNDEVIAELSVVTGKLKWPVFGQQKSLLLS